MQQASDQTRRTSFNRQAAAINPISVVAIIAALLAASADASAASRQSGACLKGTTMINNVFDPTQLHPHACYGRMSNDSQNPHSPERQYATIAEVLKRLKFPWVRIRDYRDDAISGRLVGKRPGFQAMLADIRAGIIKIDCILVDTYERIGRAEEIPSILRELRVKHGVFLLAANKNFAAPTGPEGMLLAAVEQYRAVEENRTKAHQVVSGKNLKASNGFWPGGPVPIGLKLEAVFVTRKDIEVLDGHKLVPDPTTAWIVQKLFQKADESKWGTTRLARWLNDDANVPGTSRTFSADPVGYILDNKIYRGDLIWQRNATDIIDDTRLVLRNPADVVKTYSEFCEPLVSPALWDRVHALRQERSKNIKLARAMKETANAKKIKPLAPGLVLKHPLSGLVRCAHCGRAMRPMTSGAKSKAGATYCYYLCPGHLVRVCPNGKYVREEPLRTEVLSALRARLFTSSLGQGQMPDWFAPLVEDIQHELDEMHGGDRDECPALREELGLIEEKTGGWSITLANRDAPALVRTEVEKQYDAAIRRAAEINGRLNEIEAMARQATQIIDPTRVLNRLHDIDHILKHASPTAIALELSNHIDRIDCYSDGRVEMFTVRTGVIEGLTAILSARTGVGRTDAAPAQGADGTKRITPRRRGKLRIVLTGDSPATAAMTDDVGLDPARFAGLSETFFQKDTFTVLARRCWSADHALEVALKRKTTSLTQAGLAKHFGVSRPTIRHALKLAEEINTEDETRTTPTV